MANPFGSRVRFESQKKNRRGNNLGAASKWRKRLRHLERVIGMIQWGSKNLDCDPEFLLWTYSSMRWPDQGRI